MRLRTSVAVERPRARAEAREVRGGGVGGEAHAAQRPGEGVEIVAHAVASR